MGHLGADPEARGCRHDRRSRGMRPGDQDTGRDGGHSVECNWGGRTGADLLDEVLDRALAAPHAPDVVQPVDVALDAQQDGGAVEGGPVGEAGEGGTRWGRRGPGRRLPGVLAVHAPLVALQEIQGQRVVGHRTGDELTQHLGTEHQHPALPSPTVRLHPTAAGHPPARPRPPRCGCGSSEHPPSMATSPQSIPRHSRVPSPSTSPSHPHVC